MNAREHPGQPVEHPRTPDLAVIFPALARETAAERRKREALGPTSTPGSPAWEAVRTGLAGGER